MKSFFHNRKSLCAFQQAAGETITGNSAGINIKKWILPILFLCLMGSALYGQGGTILPRSFMHEGNLRNYILYVPNAYTGQEAWSLVIHYHGFGISAATQMDYTNMNATADTAHFLVAYPQGLIVEDLIFGGSGPGWYIPGSYGADHDDVAFTDSLIDHIDADYNIDLMRVHATGWSNGGEMSYYLACKLSDRIASIASVSNAMNEMSFDSCQAGRPFSTLLFHGTADPFFPYTGVPGAFPPPPLTPAFWAVQNNCSTDSLVSELPNLVAGDSCTVTSITYQNCVPGAEVQYYRINDGGHTWPGSVPNPGWEWLGPTSQDIDANSIIWNFFQRNPLLPVGIGDHDPTDQLLESFYLFHNYPNPFNPSTVIGYRLSVASRVELSIFDLLGKKVRTLVDERQPAGQYEVRWNGEDADGNALSAGIYFYRMKAGDHLAVRKMTYIK